MMKKYLPHLPAVLVGLMLTISGIGKFIGPPEVMEAFTKMNLMDYRYHIAVLEIICALLYLYPKTAAWGFYLLCSYLGGAICMHLSLHESFISPAFILAVVWVGMYFRRPSMFWGQ